LLRGESLSGHPEGAQAPEGSPATGWDAILSEVRCLKWRFFSSFRMTKGGRMTKGSGMRKGGRMGKGSKMTKRGRMSHNLRGLHTPKNAPQ
jgi:hypothetical protein